jgi:hypothetical protein
MSPLQPLTKVPDNMAEENGAKGINGEDSIDIRNTVGSIAKEVTLSSMGLWPEKKGVDSSPSNEHVLVSVFEALFSFFWEKTPSSNQFYILPFFVCVYRMWRSFLSSVLR